MGGSSGKIKEEPNNENTETRAEDGYQDPTSLPNNTEERRV